MSDATQRLLELKKKLLSSSRPSQAPEVPKAPAPLAQPAPRPLVSPRAAEEPAADSRRSSLDSSASESTKKKQPLTLRALMGQKQKSSLPVVPEPTTGSRLKEAPAHRAAGLVAESKSNLIRSKMISLTKDPSSSVADKIAHFEQNPPPALLQPLVSPPAAEKVNHPFASFLQPVETLPKTAVPEKVIPVPGLNTKAIIPIPEKKVEVPARPAVSNLPVPAPIPTDNAGVVKFIQDRKMWLKRRSREAGLEFTNTKRLKRSPNVAEFIQEHKRFQEALVVIK